MLRDLWLETTRDDHRLPSEPVLADILGVSRPALREAMIRLESEGLVRRRRGDATYVNRSAASIGIRFDQQMEYTDVLERSGFNHRLELIHTEIVELGEHAAEQLEVNHRSPAIREVKRWWADSVVAMAATNLIPLTSPSGERFEPPPPDELPNSLFPLVQQLRNDTLEWEIARPGARVLTDAERHRFDDDVPEAVLTLSLLGVTRRGDLAYLTEELHRPGLVPFGFVRSFGR